MDEWFKKDSILYSGFSTTSDGKHVQLKTIYSNYHNIGKKPTRLPCTVSLNLQGRRKLEPPYLRTERARKSVYNGPPNND